MVDFLGIGAQKSGTTWLAEMLSRHPQVKFPAGKEVHFWDMHYANGYDWYNAPFAPEPGIKKGDITPAYGILPPETIHEIHQHFPNAPLIYSVRNPMDRAWSSALMALKRAEMTFDETSDHWFLDHFHSAGSMKRGDYEQCLKNWLAIYPKKQLLLIRYDDIAARPREVLIKTAKHIGIDPRFFETMAESILYTKVFEGEKHLIRPHLKMELEKIYTLKMMRFEAYVKELGL